MLSLSPVRIVLQFVCVCATFSVRPVCRSFRFPLIAAAAFHRNSLLLRLLLVLLYRYDKTLSSRFAVANLVLIFLVCVRVRVFFILHHLESWHLQLDDMPYQHAVYDIHFVY